MTRGNFLLLFKGGKTKKSPISEKDQPQVRMFVLLFSFLFSFLTECKTLLFFLSGLQKCSFATSKWGPRRKPSQRRSQRKMRRLERHWKKLQWQKSQAVKRMQKNPPLQPNQGLWRPQRCRRLEPQLRAKQPASLPLLPKLAEQRKVHSKCINFKCLILVVQ